MSEPRTVSLLGDHRVEREEDAQRAERDDERRQLDPGDQQAVERAHRGAAARSRAAARARRAGRRRWQKLAIRIDENTAIAPTDRSMPAVRMISVWPSASTAMTVTCASTSDRLAAEKNRWLSDREGDDRQRQDGERARASGCACSRCCIRSAERVVLARRRSRSPVLPVAGRPVVRPSVAVVGRSSSAPAVLACPRRSPWPRRRSCGWSVISVTPVSMKSLPAVAAAWCRPWRTWRSPRRPATPSSAGTASRWRR